MAWKCRDKCSSYPIIKQDENEHILCILKDLCMEMWRTLPKYQS